MKSTNEVELEARGLKVTYQNGARGVAGASLKVPSNSIVAILGRNGAGKTSLLRGLAGFLRSERVAVSGQIDFQGAEIVSATPMATHRLGMVYVPERDKVFPSIKVSDHFRLFRGRNSPDANHQSFFSALDFRQNSSAGLLSGGERQMLALAMALEQRPKLLLVDELSLGLAPIIVGELMLALRRMTDEQGLPIVIVEQDAIAAMRIADYVYVMEHGEVVLEGPPSELSAEELGAKYLGLPTK